jgi:hypothetical protein
MVCGAPTVDAQDRQTRNCVLGISQQPIKDCAVRQDEFIDQATVPGVQGLSACTGPVSAAKNGPTGSAKSAISGIMHTDNRSVQ